jgi:hypothetical protein
MIAAHPEYNEDGMCTDHPGYVACQCIACGTTGLRARTSRAQTCGRLACMDAAHEPLVLRGKA